MTLPDGTFAASLDADTGGEEGATYTWTAGEARDVLASAGLAEAWPLVAGAYDVTEAGNGRAGSSSAGWPTMRSWRSGT